MNILFFTDHYVPAVNGIVVHLLNITQELEKRGHKVTIIAPEFKKNYQDNENVIRLPSMPFFLRPQDRLSFSIPKKIEDKIANMDIDVIHCHGFITSMFALKIAKKRKIPTITTLHTPFHEYVRWIFPRLVTSIRPMVDWLSEKYFNEFDIVVAPSLKAYNFLKKVKVVTSIELVNNGIDLDSFKDIDKNLFCKEYGITPQDKLIVLVGRLDIGKNVDLAIKAFKKVKNEVSEAKLAIIGDGTEKKKIKKLIKKLNISDSVFITGFINSKLAKSANKSAEFSIMTSDSDILPTVALEAIACGKPMVAVQDEAIVEIINPGINGFLKPKNAAMLAKAMIKLLKSKKLRDQYGKASFQLAKKFSIQVCVNRLEQLYNKIT